MLCDTQDESFRWILYILFIWTFPQAIAEDDVDARIVFGTVSIPQLPENSSLPGYFIYLFIYLFIIYLFVWLFVYLCIYHLFIYQFIYYFYIFIYSFFLHLFSFFLSLYMYFYL